MYNSGERFAHLLRGVLGSLSSAEDDRYVKLVPVVTHAKSLAPLRAETSKNNESAGTRAPLGHASRRFPAGVVLSSRRVALRTATVPRE